MDSHNLEPHELNDRIKLYSHKLSQQWSSLPEDNSNTTNGERTKAKPPRDAANDIFTGFLKDVPSSEAERLLSSAPITDADLHQVRPSI